MRSERNPNRQNLLPYPILKAAYSTTSPVVLGCAGSRPPSVHHTLQMLQHQNPPRCRGGRVVSNFPDFCLPALVFVSPTTLALTGIDHGRCGVALSFSEFDS